MYFGMKIQEIHEVKHRSEAQDGREPEANIRRR